MGKSEELFVVVELVEVVVVLRHRAQAHNGLGIVLDYVILPEI